VVKEKMKGYSHSRAERVGFRFAAVRALVVATGLLAADTTVSLDLVVGWVVGW
jgi:hypothetical protein